MKSKKLASLLGTTGFMIIALTTIATEANAATLLRIYNPNSGEHHYTKSSIERDYLLKAGWKNEGIGWNTPSSGSPVYRLYNPNAGDHHYTTSASEKNGLIITGWKDEGIAWQSGGSVPVYRLYNPNALAGSHHYTLSSVERDWLVKSGWKNEGIGFYSITENAKIEDNNTSNNGSNSNEHNDTTNNGNSSTTTGDQTGESNGNNSDSKPTDNDTNETVPDQNNTVGKPLSKTIKLTVNKVEAGRTFETNVFDVRVSGQTVLDSDQNVIEQWNDFQPDNYIDKAVPYYTFLSAPTDLKVDASTNHLTLDVQYSKKAHEQLTKDFTRIIKFTDSFGNSLRPDVTETKSITGLKDPETGSVSWSQPSVTFANYQAPAIPGYIIVAEAPSFSLSADANPTKTQTIIYEKEPSSTSYITGYEALENVARIQSVASDFMALIPNIANSNAYANFDKISVKDVSSDSYQVGATTLKNKIKDVNYNYLLTSSDIAQHPNLFKYTERFSNRYIEQANRFRARLNLPPLTKISENKIVRYAYTRAIGGHISGKHLSSTTKNSVLGYTEALETLVPRSSKTFGFELTPEALADQHLKLTLSEAKNLDSTGETGHLKILILNTKAVGSVYVDSAITTPGTGIMNNVQFNTYQYTTAMEFQS